MINLVFRSVCTARLCRFVPLGQRTSDFVEGRLHLGNERKKGFSLGLHYLWPAAEGKMHLGNERKKGFFFAFPSVFITSDFVESRLHLGKTQINLVFHSVCTTFETTSRSYSRSEMLK